MPTHTGHDLGQYRGTGYGQLCQYRKADGTDQTWAGVDDWRPAGEYRDKAEELEPRAQASLYFYGVNPKNNTGNSRWDLYQNWQLEYKWQDGCAKNIKFWYEAGSREWFEFPIYRMAEFYLNIAEAYNEEGNPTMALRYLNDIRRRGGIPDETQCRGTPANPRSSPITRASPPMSPNTRGTSACPFRPLRSAR